MVASLEARLADAPDDLEGWLMLGRSRGVLGNAPGAVEAYRRAQALAADDPRAIGGLGESLTDVAGGMVTPEAEALFDRLGEVEPGDPRAGFYLGWADSQAGDHNAALERWRRLLAATPGRRALAPARRRGDPGRGGRAAARPGGGAGADPDRRRAAAPQPERRGRRRGGGDAAEERQAMIRGMVDKLQARMDADGSDVEGWLRLAQSRLVLGEAERARATFEQALALHPDDPALLKGYGGTLVGPVRADTGLPEIGDRASELFTKAASLQPDDPEPWWYLGIRALQEGQKARGPERLGEGAGPPRPEPARVPGRSRAASTASAADAGRRMGEPLIAGFGFATIGARPDLADLDRALGRIEDAGASHAELELFAADLIAGGRVLPGPRRRLEQLCGRRRLRYTAHGTLSVNFMDEANLDHHKAVCRANLELAAAVGATVLVQHPGIVPPGRRTSWTDCTRSSARPCARWATSPAGWACGSRSRPCSSRASRTTRPTRPGSRPSSARSVTRPSSARSTSATAT